MKLLSSSFLLSFLLLQLVAAQGPGQGTDPLTGLVPGNTNNSTSPPATGGTTPTLPAGGTQPTDNTASLSNSNSQTTSPPADPATSAPPPSTSAPSSPSTSAPSSPPPPSLPVQASTSQTVSTAADGAVTTIQSIITVPASSTPSNTPTAAASNSGSGSGSGLGTGSIIGLSVAGGVALLGIVGFLIWKLTRKRFHDFDDNEAIKWPELNTHSGGGSALDSVALPVNNTGRSGFGDTASEVSLDRAAYSTSDLNSVHQDPYAVPPLPHMNPNQPYRDDPTAQTGYYDPYNGPVPQTFQPEGEAIPMTQLGGRMSPGPNVAYGYQDQMGRASPAPSAAMAQYGGRSSPGPHLAYGRASPGPGPAYGGPQ